MLSSQARLTSAAAALEARLEAYDIHALGLERVKAALELCRLNVRAARALIARRFGEVADHGDARSLAQGKDAAFVFEQHRALLGKPRGKFVVLV